MDQEDQWDGVPLSVVANVHDCNTAVRDSKSNRVVTFTYRANAPREKYEPSYTFQL